MFTNSFGVQVYRNNVVIGVKGCGQWCALGSAFAINCEMPRKESIWGLPEGLAKYMIDLLWNPTMGAWQGGNLSAEQRRE